MATYYASFSIADDLTYQIRYTGLTNLLKKLAESNFWDKTTSFIVFDSALDVDAISAQIKAVIRPSTDTVVLGKTEFKTMRVIGLNADQDIYKLVPFAKKA